MRRHADRRARVGRGGAKTCASVTSAAPAVCSDRRSRAEGTAGRGRRTGSGVGVFDGERRFQLLREPLPPGRGQAAVPFQRRENLRQQLPAVPARVEAARLGGDVRGDGRVRGRVRPAVARVGGAVLPPRRGRRTNRRGRAAPRRLPTAGRRSPSPGSPAGSRPSPRGGLRRCPAPRIRGGRRPTACRRSAAGPRGAGRGTRAYRERRTNGGRREGGGSPPARGRRRRPARRGGPADFSDGLLGRASPLRSGGFQPPSAGAAGEPARPSAALPVGGWKPPLRTPANRIRTRSRPRRRPSCPGPTRVPGRSNR